MRKTTRLPSLQKALERDVIRTKDRPIIRPSNVEAL